MRNILRAKIAEPLYEYIIRHFNYLKYNFLRDYRTQILYLYYIHQVGVYCCLQKNNNKITNMS